MYRALITFSGKVSMAEGEIRDISDKAVVDDLLDAGYIEEITPAKKEKPKAEPKKKEPEDVPEKKPEDVPEKKPEPKAEKPKSKRKGGKKK